MGGFFVEFEAVRTAQVARIIPEMDPASGRWGITFRRQAGQRVSEGPGRGVAGRTVVVVASRAGARVAAYVVARVVGCLCISRGQGRR